MQVGKYTKAIVTILAAGLGIFVAANSDGVVTPVEYVSIGIALLTAVSTYLIPNLDAGVAKYAKTIVAFGGAALTALTVIVAHSTDWSGVSGNDWLSVLLAGLAAIGVYILPNVAGVVGSTVINTSTANVDAETAKVIADKLAKFQGE